MAERKSTVPGEVGVDLKGRRMDEVTTPRNELASLLHILVFEVDERLLGVGVDVVVSVPFQEHA